MAANGYYATKTYRCGRIGEKVKYFVPSSRVRTGEGSSPAKIEGNRNNAVRRMARLLNENFRPGDGWLTLTYNAARLARVEQRAAGMDPSIPETDRLYMAAEHELRLLMDRARAALKKQGIELKYVAVTSDMDADTGELVRVHHHVVCTAECATMLREKWGGKDFNDPERPDWKGGLKDQEDYTPLAEYMVKQIRHIANAKKWMSSRNLIRSDPKPRKVISGAPLRAPKGCRLLYADPYTGVCGCQYIRYLLPAEEWTGVWADQKPDSTRRAHVARDKIGNSEKETP